MNRKIELRNNIWKTTSVLLGLVLVVASGNVRVKRQDAISLGPSLGNYADGCSAGDVKILDEHTIEITDMKYNGKGPHAWFVVSNSPQYAVENADLRPLALMLRDDDRSCVKPPAYTGGTVKLKMPQNDKVQNYKGFSLFCFRYNHNFCYVKIPEGTQPPPGTGGYTETCKPDYFDGAEKSQRENTANMTVSSKSVQVEVSSLLALSTRALLGILQFKKFSP